MIECDVRKNHRLVSDDKKSIFQFLPKDLIDISKSNKIEFNGKDIKTQYLIDIVHNLILKFYFKKKNSFSLSSLILKEKYGCHYNYYIEYLLKNNIIILKKNYLKGSNARIYSLH